MLICGVKVSHDAAVALIDGNRLLFSIELEKLNNNDRYTALDHLESIEEILHREGVDPRDIDRFVLDGWYPPSGAAKPVVSSRLNGFSLSLPVAPYVGETDGGNPLRSDFFPGVSGSVLQRGYNSYPHVSGHVMSSYCSSPFATRGEDAIVLAWDGGTLPRCYWVDWAARRVKSLGVLFPLVGNMFGDFCAQLPPFFHDETGLSHETLTRHDLEVPGKAMAYAALGYVEPTAFSVFDSLLDELDPVSTSAATQLGKTVITRRDNLFPGLSNADLVATFQAYLGNALCEGLARLLQRNFEGRTLNMCLSGGCALNIKWNSQLRASGMFRDIWVPPFPNDAGSAIGAACCEMASQGGHFDLEWNVYSGPRLQVSELPGGWDARSHDECDIAALMHHENEPVAVLHGRAELGPRALGNRSILAPAVDPEMKHRLNMIKGRADYRPVAPICLTAHAAKVFEPGGADPYMVFEHRMRTDWANRLPAIVHIDGTARLQTIETNAAGSCVGRILQHYERLSGIPVLCNTSANLGGRGFFSSAAAAASWGRIRYVWSDGTLYVKRTMDF